MTGKEFLKKIKAIPINKISSSEKALYYLSFADYNVFIENPDSALFYYDKAHKCKIDKNTNKRYLFGLASAYCIKGINDSIKNMLNKLNYKELNIFQKINYLWFKL